ncbi:MAG: FIST C-terminal domain-containing protein [Chitinivibrionales bacterium]|nr:FIST C-terminal domain-containing protein [Chitinivibrionales bacterium]
MNVGIGYSNISNSFQSGENVGTQAVERYGITRPDLVIAFISEKTEPAAFIKGLRSVVGETVPIIGGSAIGVVTTDNLTYLQHQCAAAVISSDSLHYEIAVADRLNDGEQNAGRTLGAKLAGISGSKLLLLLYDAIRKEPGPLSPPQLYSSTYLLNGILETLNADIPIFGSGLHGSIDFKRSISFIGDRISSDSAIAVTLAGDFEVHYRIMHGCTLLDGIYHTITKADGAFVYEIDGVNAVQFFDTLFGNDNWRRENPVKRVNIGVNYGGQFEAFNESNYVNRLIMGALPENRGILLFEADLDVGTRFQVMLRDTNEIIESAKRNTEESIRLITDKGKRIVFSLYIDCAGRTSYISDSLNEEAAEVQNICKNHGVPLLGFYTGVEIAPFCNRSRGLDWTGVLLSLVQPK